MSVSEATDKGVEAYNRSEFVTALPLLQSAASQGDAKAQFYLGLMSFAGLGVPQNIDQCISMLTKSADGGYVEAEVVLGEMYSLGKGVSKDRAKAAVWYERAADHGSAAAQAFLGEQYAIGDGVEQDSTKATELCGKSAEQGDADGETCMGNLYRYGIGFSQDYRKAKSWYQKAAAKGDKDAADKIRTMQIEASAAIRDSVKHNGAFQFRCSLLAFDGAHPRDGGAYRRRYEQCLNETADHLEGKRAAPPGTNSPLWNSAR